MRKLRWVTLLLFFLCSLHAQKEVYSIGILTDNQSPELTPLLAELQRQVRVVVGEDATVLFPAENILVNDFDLDLAARNYEQLLGNETDIILAFGAVNNQVISRQSQFPKPTILFGAVNRDLFKLEAGKTTSGINNFTYLIQSESYLTDITVLKELTDFNTVGIVLEAALVDMLPVRDIFDQELSALGAMYKLIPYRNVADITGNLNGIDAVYLAGGYFLSDAEIDQLSAAFIERKLPSFTNTSISDVERGLMATNQGENSLAQIQRRIALTVEAYVNGTNLADLPVFIDYEPRLTINFNTAELLQVPIKYSLISTTDFVGNLENVISEEDYNLLSAINQALGKNLTLATEQKDIDLSNQDIASAKSEYLPSVEAAVTSSYVDPRLAEASFGQNPEFSTSGSIIAKQLIYSRAVRANIAIQKDLLAAQRENFNASQLDIVADVASTYLATLIAKANAQIQLQNLDLTKQNLEIAEQNFAAGESGKSDVLRFRSEVAQNTQSMVEAINQLEQNFVVLNQLLNNPIGREIDVEDVKLDEGLLNRYNYDELTNILDNPNLREAFTDFLVAESLKNAPELKELGYTIGATQRSIDLFGTGRFYPTVAAQGQYNLLIDRSGAGSESNLPTGGTINNSNYNLGVNISLPIFNQNTNNINQQTAKIQKEQLLLSQSNIELALAANVRTNVLTLINQISNIELSEVSESTAKEALDLTQTAYSSGAVSLIQLIDAQNNLLNAQLARAGAVYNFLINAIRLERSMGYFFLLNSEEDNLNFRQRFLQFVETNDDGKR